MAFFGLLLVVSDSRAQSAAAAVGKLDFDVASVRQNRSGSKPESNFPLGPGDMYTHTGGVFSASDQPLITYIAFAYKLTISQLQVVRQRLPEWVMTDRFDIEARSEVRDPSKEQMRLMMRSLLADRFRLRVHEEARQLPVFGLVLAKPGRTGPKLRPHGEQDGSCAASPSPAAGVVGGYPEVCGGLALMPTSAAGGLGGMNVGARNVSLDFIARSLAGIGELERPVVDQTGLGGSYDFALEFTPERLGAQTESEGTTFPEALREQLGLKLAAQKGSVDLVIVDSVERPSKN
jgi:uncharacterized protein (TIGR03435 family)